MPAQKNDVPKGKHVLTHRQVRFLNILFNFAIVLSCAFLIGYAFYIVLDLQPNVRTFNVGSYFQSNENSFYANLVFYFRADEAFCAYNPIHVRAVLFGNRLNTSAVAEILLEGSRFVPDKLDVYGLIPQTGAIVLHAPTDPNLTQLAADNPTGLILEGETDVQWNLEGDYHWGLANVTENIIFKGEFQGSPIIHISSVDVMTQIRSNQRMEALTFAIFGLSILSAQPIIKAIALHVAESAGLKEAVPVFQQPEQDAKKH